MKKLIKFFQEGGLTGLLKVLVIKIRNLVPVRAKCYSELTGLFDDAIGFEIGGYSVVFGEKGIFPVYPIAGRIDNCNFDSKTIWEGHITVGQTFQFNPNKSSGFQYVSEATNLEFINDENYDFVLSSHVLEHIANPVLALNEWIRILKVSGLLVLLLPHKDGTFDHRRPVTTMEHLVSDFENNIGEDDLTHSDEILSLHDLGRDPEAGDFVSFKRRSENNFENRCFHHHVFNTELAIQLVDYVGLKIKSVETFLPFHIVIVAQKSESYELIDNSVFMDKSALYRNCSPFSSDHL